MNTIIRTVGDFLFDQGHIEFFFGMLVLYLIQYLLGICGEWIKGYIQQAIEQEKKNGTK